MDSLANAPENGFYVHYKHDPLAEPHNYLYEVVGIVRNTEDKTLSVLYRPLYENDWFKEVSFQSRPLTMFVEDVTIDGVTKPRFAKITDPSLIAELETVRNQMYPA